MSLFSFSVLAENKPKPNQYGALDKVVSESVSYNGWKDLSSIKIRAVKRSKWTDWKDSRSNKSWKLPRRTEIKGSGNQRGIVEPMF